MDDGIARLLDEATLRGGRKPAYAHKSGLTGNYLATFDGHPDNLCMVSPSDGNKKSRVLTWPTPQAVNDFTAERYGDFGRGYMFATLVTLAPEKCVDYQSLIDTVKPVAEAVLKNGRGGDGWVVARHSEYICYNQAMRMYTWRSPRWLLGAKVVVWPTKAAATEWYGTRELVDVAVIYNPVVPADDAIKISELEVPLVEAVLKNGRACDAWVLELHHEYVCYDTASRMYTWRHPRWLAKATIVTWPSKVAALKWYGNNAQGGLSCTQIANEYAGSATKISELEVPLAEAVLKNGKDDVWVITVSSKDGSDSSAMTYTDLRSAQDGKPVYQLLRVRWLELRSQESARSRVLTWPTRQAAEDFAENRWGGGSLDDFCRVTKLSSLGLGFTDCVDQASIAHTVHEAVVKNGRSGRYIIVSGPVDDTRPTHCLIKSEFFPSLLWTRLAELRRSVDLYYPDLAVSWPTPQAAETWLRTAPLSRTETRGATAMSAVELEIPPERLCDGAAY